MNQNSLKSLLEVEKAQFALLQSEPFTTQISQQKRKQLFLWMANLSEQMKIEVQYLLTAYYIVKFYSQHHHIDEEYLKLLGLIALYQSVYTQTEKYEKLSTEDKEIFLQMLNNYYTLDQFEEVEQNIQTLLLEHSKIVSPADFKDHLPKHKFATVEEGEEFQQNLNGTIALCFIRHPDPFSLLPSTIYLSSIFFMLDNYNLDVFQVVLCQKVEDNEDLNHQEIQDIYEYLFESIYKEEQQPISNENNTPPQQDTSASPLKENNIQYQEKEKEEQIEKQLDEKAMKEKLQEENIQNSQNMDIMVEEFAKETKTPQKPGYLQYSGSHSTQCSELVSAQNLDNENEKCPDVPKFLI